MRHLPAGTLGRGIAARERYRLVAALLAGGDSRLSVDLYGVNKYLCRPLPAPAIACLSSCTASPISEVGFRWAAAAFEHIALAPKALELDRIEACETATVLACFIHGVEGERQARWPLGVREGGAICAVCAELTA
jgi:hypothetical protein